VETDPAPPPHRRAGVLLLLRHADRRADLLRKVVELMAGELVPDDRRAQIAEMARAE
jgi:hypothetical protein